jgi:hypothetical protein
MDDPLSITRITTFFRTLTIYLPAWRRYLNIVASALAQALEEHSDHVVL